AQRCLKIGNHLRHRGLRYSKLRGGFRHAPVLNNGEKQVQVPQREALANLTVRIKSSRHRTTPIAAKEILELSYIKFGLVFAISKGIQDDYDVMIVGPCPLGSET